MLNCIKNQLVMKIGKIIIVLRKKNEFTQTELADLTKISLNTIKNIEYNKASTTKEQIEILAEAFDMSSGQLLNYEISEEDELNLMTDKELQSLIVSLRKDIKHQAQVIELLNELLAQYRQH